MSSLIPGYISAREPEDPIREQSANVSNEEPSREGYALVYRFYQALKEDHEYVNHSQSIMKRMSFQLASFYSRIFTNLNDRLLQGRFNDLVKKDAESSITIDKYSKENGEHKRTIKALSDENMAQGKKIKELEEELAKLKGV
jgi:hypothetical protein